MQVGFTNEVILSARSLPLNRCGCVVYKTTSAAEQRNYIIVYITKRPLR